MLKQVIKFTASKSTKSIKRTLPEMITSPMKTVIGSWILFTNKIIHCKLYDWDFIKNEFAPVDINVLRRSTFTYLTLGVWSLLQLLVFLYGTVVGRWQMVLENPQEFITFCIGCSEIFVLLMVLLFGIQAWKHSGEMVYILNQIFRQSEAFHSKFDQTLSHAHF